MKCHFNFRKRGPLSSVAPQDDVPDDPRPSISVGYLQIHFVYTQVIFQYSLFSDVLLDDSADKVAGAGRRRPSFCASSVNYIEMHCMDTHE